MVKPLNVLAIVNSLQFGGAENHLISLLNHLDPEKFGLSLAYLKPLDHLLSQVDRRRCGNGIFCCHVSRKIDWRAVRELSQHIDDRKVDVVMCINNYPLLYGWLARRLSRRKPALIALFHSTLLGTLKEKLQMLFYFPLFRASDVLLYVSENQRVYWRARGLRARQDIVVHNGIDVEHFVNQWGPDEKIAMRQRFGFSPDDYVVGLCAAMRPEKAHGDLLVAVARLRQQGLNVKCLLIGDGPERTAIERKTAELGLTACVKITGFMTDVRPVMCACDVMALVSHAETFSVAALEAMALDIPMIMTDIGGAREQIAEGVNGFLYPPKDIDTLIQRIRQLSDPESRKRMGAAARKMVVDRFSVGKMVEQYSTVLGALTIAGSSDQS